MGQDGVHRLYDENDGYFDHVPPPTPPPGTPGEYVDGAPLGLGFRVPAIVVSPWSVGGRVCSDVLDHTSLIRLIEARFGVHEPNISQWRRSAVGDFTGAFAFDHSSRWRPRGDLQVDAADAHHLDAQRQVNDNAAPAVPEVNEPLPT